MRSHPQTAALPIIVHGYDYTFAYPTIEDGQEDPRAPIYAARDEWLGCFVPSFDGAVFSERGIDD